MTKKEKEVKAKLTPTDDKKRVEVVVKLPKIILGVHSNVPSSAGFTDGHAWLTVSRDGVITNYGLWPDDHPRIVAMKEADPDKSDVRIGMEAGEVGISNRYYQLTAQQVTVLEQKLKEYAGWHYTNTCASWASETATTVTGETLDANDTLGFETPRQLSKSIDALEAKNKTTQGAPKVLANPKASSSAG